MRLEEFKNHLKIQGKVLAYYHNMKIFFKQHDVITKENMEIFILNLMKKELKKTTIYNYICAINAYLRFIESDIKPLKTIRLDETIPNAITREMFEKEVLPVIDMAFQGNARRRSRAILYYMFFTGARIQEVIEQKRKNINFAEQEILTFNKKSKKEKLLPLVAPLSKELQIYFRAEAEKTNLFNTTRSQIYYIFRILKENFPKTGFHPHLMRASFATYFLEQGASITDIQYLLGHKKIETTMRYCAVQFKRIKKSILTKIK